jgi:hypothetical protein
MKKILLFVFFLHIVYASDDNLKNMSLLELFNKQYYTYICDRRWQYINEYNNKREDLLSLVAYACLKKRYLTPALDLAKVLKATKEGRRNATYIVTLFLMKKLIIQYFNDGLSLRGIKLPKITDNTLGIVFNYIESGKYEKKDNYLVIKTPDILYKVTISKNNNIVIETYKNNKLEKREYFW